MAEQGFIISFSGLDGSGKSTFVDFAVQWLRENTDRNITVADAMKPSKFHAQLKKPLKP
jgi:thymidylate kinase